MDKKSFGVGVFVVVGIALLTIGLFLVGSRSNAFSAHIDYYCEFGNVGGLSNRAIVQVGGLDAGQVVAIDILRESSFRYRVRWRIPESSRDLVRTDSMCTVETKGVVGDMFLAIKPGSPTAPLAARLATIPSKDPVTLSDLIARGSGLLDDADTSLKRTQVKVESTLDGIHSTVQSLDQIAKGVNAGRGTVGMLFRDADVAAHVRQTVANLAEGTTSVNAALKDNRNPIGMLLHDKAVAGQLQQTVTNAQQTSVELRRTAAAAAAIAGDLKNDQVPAKVTALVDHLDGSARQIQQLTSTMTKADPDGTSPADVLKETLANANVATENLADDTEALKHNFLLRGFFNRRGFYNLAQISPEEYRKDRSFTAPSNFRGWLAGTDLFLPGTEAGTETLSVGGKALLDGAMAESGYAVLPGPIVIEGYQRGNDPQKQLLGALHRAQLVRQYLETKYHLAASKIGIVGLNESPPKAAGRPSWDGVCIVIMHPASK